MRHFWISVGPIPVRAADMARIQPPPPTLANGPSGKRRIWPEPLMSAGPKTGGGPVRILKVETFDRREALPPNLQAGIEYCPVMGDAVDFDALPWRKGLES